MLTFGQWKGVSDFIKATDSKLVTFFAVLNSVRDDKGIWTPKEAKKIENYTQSIGGSIAAVELFNELTMHTAGGEILKSHNGHDFAKDVAVFSTYAKSSASGMTTLGSVSVGKGSSTVKPQGVRMTILPADSIMSAEPKPVFDAFSYRFYGAASVRMIRSGPFSIKAENVLDDA